MSMSQAREAMHLFTDSKAALREAVTKPSGRLSGLELILDQSDAARAESASVYLRNRAAEQMSRRQIQEQEMER